MVLHPAGKSLDNARLRDFKVGGLRLKDIPGPVVVAGAAVLLLARFTGRPMIAVTGVTGPIGASVVQALDKDRKLRVRAIVQSHERAQVLNTFSQHVEIVEADFNSIQSIKAAFHDCYGAVLSTNYWDYMNMEKEQQVAKNMADAAKLASLDHVVWCTLEDTRKFIGPEFPSVPLTNLTYKVPHFDAKGEMDEYMRRLGLPVTFVLTSFIWENLIYSGMGPRRGPDGVIALTLPMGDRKMPGIAADDIGPCIAAVFKDKKYIGKRIGLAGEHPTCVQMSAILTKVLGKYVKYNPIPPATFAKLGERDTENKKVHVQGAHELANMFQFKRDFEELYCGNRPVALGKKLHSGLKSFEEWALIHKSAFFVSA